MDIPVNYHTGIPTIGIPIYTVRGGSLTLPFNLIDLACIIKWILKISLF